MFWNNRHISERKERVTLWGEGESLYILHLSDIHLWYSTGILTGLAALIEKHQPHIIILTGDYYDLPKGAHNFRAFLKQVARKHMVVFIRGNHDKMYGSKIADLLLGIPNCICVEDAVYTYQSKQGRVYHITSWEARAQLPIRECEANIVLIHNPEKIKEQELANIDLILAGHLHGGQFVFFKTKTNAHFPGSLLYKHCTDRKQIGNTTLIISRGLGDTFPFRLNCPKEIVHITIE
jgi:predicted MPP superfamily phosphohydrolase